jgi:hypothetical protein
MLRRDIPSVTNPERMAQLVFGAVLVRHELIHVKQFAAAKRPQTYADMCKCEVAAYRDTAKWMRAARTDLRDLGLTDAVIDYFQRLQLDIQTHAEATLKEITQLDTEEQRKEVMVREEFLPEHGTIDELYKA